MYLRIGILLLLGLTASCKKWVDYKDPVDNTKRDTGNLQPGGEAPVDPPVTPKPTETEPPSGIEGVQTGKIPDGHIQVDVKAIKSEENAFYKNCIFLDVSRSGFSDEVGCNKKQDTKRFLKDSSFEQNFKVTDQEKVEINFRFETWKPESADCILYGDTEGRCAEPYTGVPAKRSLKENKSSLRCFKLGDNKYRFYYEDQDDDVRDADFAMRKNLVVKGTTTEAAPFNPEKSSRGTTYELKSGFSLDSSVKQQRCLSMRNSVEGEVTEASMQACYGIDFQDLVFDVEWEKANVELGGATDECEAI